MFETEKDMVIALISLLENKRVKLNKIKEFIILQEVEGLVGRPDIMLKGENKIITIELKLKNWKRALAQAYKYKSFSDISYVCIDEKNSKPALNQIDMFKKYNIGLISISLDNKITIYNKPLVTNAYVKELYKNATTKFAC